MTKRRVSASLSVRWVVIAVWLLAACGEPPAPPPPQGRVLLLGLDGATARVAGPLIEQGRLPNLARIAEEGASGPLRSFRPLLSPRIWTTIATGKTPARHGILDWVKRDEEGHVRLYSSRDRKVHALWNIASDAGLEVGVVNWLVTYPPERIRGVMISDHALPEEAQARRNLGGMFAKMRFGEALGEAGAEEGAGPVCFPEEWKERVVDLVGGDSDRKRIPARDAESFVTWVTEQNLARDREIVKLALAVEEERRPDLLMVLLQGIDRVSHVMWGAIEPQEIYPEDQRLSAERQELGSAALHGYYEASDALVGQLVDRFGEDDLVIVLSDHGFEAAFGNPLGTGSHVSDAARDGILFTRGPAVQAGASVGAVTVNDITPTILTWLGLPVASDMQGRPAGFLELAAGDRIATYDTTPIERLSDEPSGAEGQILEQLESLGYVE